MKQVGSVDVPKEDFMAILKLNNNAKKKDFGNAAYATIRSFVLKFEKLGLLKSTQYGKRVKYAVRVC